MIKNFLNKIAINGNKNDSQILLNFFQPFNHKNVSVIVALKFNPKTYTSPLIFKHGEISETFSKYDSELLRRAMTQKEHDKVIDLLRILSTFLGTNKIEHMIIDGSLLGSWRFWDVMPWDDDCDIMTSKLNYDKLRHLFATQTQFPQIEWSLFNNDQFKAIKVYFKNDGSPYAGAYSWRYPFIDILFYNQNETHLWQEEIYTKSISRLDYIFPLVFRPFGRYWFPSPRRPLDYFNSVYNIKGEDNIDKLCIKSHWNHKDESEQKIIRVECKMLRKHYKFVTHQFFNQTHLIEEKDAQNEIQRIIYEL